MPWNTRCTSTPDSTSSAASLSDFGVVFVYWKRPVSVTSAMYSASAISGVRRTSSSRRMSRTISPVEDAFGTIRFSFPKRVLSWWWSTSTVSAKRSKAPSWSPVRFALAQSSATSTRSDTSGGSSRRSDSSSMNPYSCGSAIVPARNMTLSLPSCARACCMPRIEPSASPSGFSCVTSRKRSFARIASATAPSSLVWGELIDQLRHPNPPFHGRIVFEGQLRGPLQPELPADPALEDAVGRAERRHGLLALALAAENADVDARLTEVRRRVDAGHGDEADPRVLQLEQPFRQHLADGLVHTAHPLRHRAERPPNRCSSGSRGQDTDWRTCRCTASR